MSFLVVKALGLVTVQDLGRPGRMHEALPRGGALVPSMLVQANRAIGNADDAAALEVCGQLVLRAESDVTLAVPATRILRAGQELTVSSDPARVTYVAVRGGIETPIILGARGAHVSAGIGRFVRAGDRLASSSASIVDAMVPGSSVRVIPGPDLDAFDSGAIQHLVDTEWRISASSNRVGTRLEGSAIARREGFVEQSRPMVIGAIEVPRDGAPIVLGPEHPTTGGYPILGVIASRDLDAFHSIPLGGRVRFRV